MQSAVDCLAQSFSFKSQFDKVSIYIGVWKREEYDELNLGSLDKKTEKKLHLLICLIKQELVQWSWADLITI